VENINTIGIRLFDKEPAYESMARDSKDRIYICNGDQIPNIYVLDNNVWSNPIPIQCDAGTAKLFSDKKGRVFISYVDNVLVQRELDKSVSPLKEYLAFGKEVFLGMRKLRMVFAAGKRGWQEFNCHPPRSFVAFG